MSDIVCLYHDDCWDGMGAAWALAQRFPTAELRSVKYTNPAPTDLEGKIVYIVDFCYPIHELMGLLLVAKQLHIYDHHEGMAETLLTFNKEIANHGYNPLKFNAVYDPSVSGALLTWQQLMPSYPAPLILRHISDRDLWLFELPHTKTVMAGLGSYCMDTKIWDKVFEWTRAYEPTDPSDPHNLFVEKMHQEGPAILRKMQTDIDRLVRTTEREITLEGHTVPLVNLPRMLASEALEHLAINRPFAVSYFDTAEHREYSLRSSKDGLNLIPITQALGGGGHPHAAGFKVRRSHPLAQH